MVYSTGKHCKKANKNKVFVKAFPHKSHKESEYGGISQQVIEDESVSLQLKKSFTKASLSTPIIKPSSEDTVWDEIAKNHITSSSVDEWDDWNDIV